MNFIVMIFSMFAPPPIPFDYPPPSCNQSSVYCLGPCEGRMRVKTELLLKRGLKGVLFIWVLKERVKGCLVHMGLEREG